MKVLVTGATGLIGNAVARKLAERGDAVRALVRDPARASGLLPAAVERFAGDILDPAALARAMDGSELVFHCAGMPEQWHADDAVFDRVNRQGTRNVLDAALAAGVRRAIYTSTMDVFGCPRGGTITERDVDPNPRPTAYERSKQAAEQEADEVRARGLDVVFCNPGAVYGPSPVHVALNSLFIQLLTGKMPMIPPGGVSLAYVDGVADAHLAAAEKGKNGERYLLADGFITIAELIQQIARAAGLPKIPKVAPEWLLKSVANASAPLARMFGFTPMIAPGQLTFLLWSAHIDASKAQRELGFNPTPAADGVARTVRFLRDQGLVPAAA